jgi:hypothetical protein
MIFLKGILALNHVHWLLVIRFLTACKGKARQAMNELIKPVRRIFHCLSTMLRKCLFSAMTRPEKDMHHPTRYRLANRRIAH